MDTDLQATCSALGYHEGTRYVKEPDCLETVKELIRFVRREDDTCDVRRQLGHAQILQKDLLPLIKQHHSDKALFETVVRLLVNLTQPVLVCYNNQLPDEKVLRQYCLQIETHLQHYKEAFVDEELFSVLSNKMTQLLQLDWEHRHEEDKLMLERLLMLVRNVLHIPPDPASEQRTDDDASLHDQILWAIHVSGMEDLLLYVASAEEERHLCMHLLEIVSLMYREHSPQVLAFAGVQRSMTEKEKDERELEMARAKEKMEKKNARLRFNTRHSNFGGTYVMANRKSLSENELIYHKSLRDADNYTLDSNKNPQKKNKNRQPLKGGPVVRRSTLSIRLGLKEFCVQFLENAYNPLMNAVKDNLVRETTQELDETYYLWAMQFFMEFCRHHSQHIDFVGETMSVATFHYIYNNLLRYYEMIMTEKKEAIVWGRRVHLALRAYQELLMTLDSMDKSSNSHLRDSARVIKSNVFYVMEFRDIFITLLKKFDESKYSRSYLKDLVESTHLFLRMLEKHSKASRHLVVRGKKRRKTKKRKAAPKKPDLTEQQLENMWQEVSSELSALLQGNEEVPQGFTPFDATSEVDIEQQRGEAMCRIHRAMRQKRAGEAVAIFRAAREVWPEREEFGSQDISTEEEFLALREIFMAPLPAQPGSGETQTEEAPIEEEEELPEEEEVEAARTNFEEEFNFTAYLMSYAKPEILKAYVTLAGDFETNTSHTNHCVVKMLHRVAFQLGFHAMLFQTSLFRVFQKVMLGPAAHTSKFKEFYTFGVHVIRKFAEAAENNKKVFMEIMFWKGSKEAMQIMEGYNCDAGKAKVTWTEQDENELIRLFEDFRDVDDPEKDAVDLIVAQWSGESKTRLQVIRHLKHLQLITSVKDLKKKHVSVHSWTEEDEQELQLAYNDHKHSDDPMSGILESLSKKRSKNVVINKLLAMDVVQDRKELYKKRGRGKGADNRRRKTAAARSDDDDDDERNSGSDNEDGHEERLPSDEEILSSPQASDVSSDDNESDDNDGGDSEDEALALVRQAEHGETSSSSSSSNMVEMLKNVVEKGYKDQVGWIQRLVIQNSKIREGQGTVFAVPIVPLTEENETAMEDTVFTDFLQRLGLSPPASEQEMFWRIPAHLTSADLRNIADGIELDEDGELVNEEKLTLIQPPKPKPSARKNKKNKETKKKRDSKTRKTDKKTKKKDKKRPEKEKRKRKKPDDSHDDDDNNRRGGDDDESDGDVRRSDDDESEKKGGEKAVTASQRRQALKAMLERRKVKKVTNRERGKNTDLSGEDDGEASKSREEVTVDTSASPTAVKDSPNVRSSHKPRKRVLTALDSDTDSEGEKETAEGRPDEGTEHSVPQSHKRARLLDSDNSGDDDEDKENRNNSTLNYNSGGEETGASQSQSITASQSQSQSQCQDPLDFGDSDNDDGDDDRNGGEKEKSQEKGDDDESSDDDIPLVGRVKRKAEPESFPATMLSQDTPASDDSDLDDHVSLGALKKKRRVLSDDDDDE